MHLRLVLHDMTDGSALLFFQDRSDGRCAYSVHVYPHLLLHLRHHRHHHHHHHHNHHRRHHHLYHRHHHYDDHHRNLFLKRKSAQAHPEDLCGEGFVSSKVGKKLSDVMDDRLLRSRRPVGVWFQDLGFCNIITQCCCHSY